MCDSLRLYGYSEHCLFGTPRWMRSLIARADWLAAALAAHPDAELRFAHHPAISLLVSRGCTDPRHRVPPHVGVHFSYFFSTASILSKLRGFLHADDANIRAVTHSADPELLVERKVATCTAIPSRAPTINASHARWANVSRLVEAKMLPDVPGWPRHPAWREAAGQ